MLVDRRIGARGERGHLEPPFERPLVQGLDVRHDRLELEPAKVDGAGLDRPDHERVVGIRGVADSDGHDAPRYPAPRAQRVDPGLPEVGLQAAGGERPRDDRRACEGPRRRAGVGVGDGQEARRARAAHTRAVSRREPHRRGQTRRARGDPPPPPARAVPRGDARRARRRRPRRGGPARARDLGGARSAHRPRARIPDARPARRPDPGREPRVA